MPMVPSRESSTRPARISPSVADSDEKHCQTVEVQSLSDSVALRFTDVPDDLRRRDTHRIDALDPTLNRSAASSSTVLSCTQAVTPIGDGSREFGVLPAHNTPEKRTPRELQESNPFFAPRKIEQTVISSKHEPYDISAFNTLDFPHRVCPPEHIQADPEKRGGWRSAFHPDGTLYFHKASQSKFGSFSMITEAYLYGEDMLHEITLFTEHMWQHMVLARDKFPDGGFELVMNVKVDPDTGNLVWSYYFIDHIRRMPFWMRDYNPSVHMRTTETLGVSSPDHLRYLLRAMYWEHCALYPYSSNGARALPDDVHAKLITDLAWCAAESILAPIRYTAPYTAEEAVRLRKELDHLRLYSQRDSGPYIEIAGRTISTLERWRYEFLHGTQVIRRFRGQSVLPPQRSSVLYRALAPTLFYAPLAHLYDCRSIYLDGLLANESEWTIYVKRLLSEWREFVIYAIILLLANLAFLAVPSTLLTSANDGLSHAVSSDRPVSSAAVLGFCSLLASLGSTMMGLLLIRQHRGEEIIDNPRSDKAVFMEKRRSTHFGFEPVSILYSLPSVLLMWSVLLLLCAVIAFTLSSSSWPARASTLAGLIVIIVSLSWCIRVGWGSSLNRDFFRYRKHTKPSTPSRRRLIPQAISTALHTFNASTTRLRGLDVFRSNKADERTKKTEETV
ncbi:hypothetical protein PENSPDRAFT_750042 [Peniophora sp. CONT]|nr:hypothetical protein PENSPDRAFT_750042 [Peniophora sp. CONT]